MNCPICGSHGLEVTDFADAFHQFVCADQNHPFVGGRITDRDIFVGPPGALARLRSWFRGAK